MSSRENTDPHDGANRAKPEHIARMLQQLGFTEYESRAYVALTQTSPATAYEVAKLAKLPRANVYSALRNLENRGAIQPVTEKPVRYMPHDPEIFFGQIQKSTTTLCTEIARLIRYKPRVDESVYVWIFRGEKDIHHKIESIILGAKKHIWIKAPVRLILPFIKPLLRAARRGVQVKLVVFGPEISRLATHPRIQVFLHEGDGVPHGAASVLLTITIDFSDVMITSYAGNALGSYARNHSIVYVVQTLMLHEIYFAEIYAAFKTELDAHFGKQLVKLREKYRPAGMEQYVLEGR
jgi:sugar-specific transcriptional regulator TrmB